MLNALTIDVEEWFHICGLRQLSKTEDWPGYESRIEENVGKILSILKEKNIKATFFVLGFIAEAYPDIVRKIYAQGHEIGSHGFGHNLLYNTSKEEFKEDLKRSIYLLENITGKKIMGYRAPSFSITDKSLWALGILKEQGIKYDCSIFPIWHPRYGIKDAPRFPYKTGQGIIEFPPSTINILGRNFPMGGGAYLRLLPYAFTRWAIKKINNAAQPAQIYLHSWELDPGIPRLEIPFDRKITHYGNLKIMQKRFDMLLKDFEFGPVKEVVNLE